MIKILLNFFVYAILVLTLQNCNTKTKKTNSTIDEVENLNNEKDLEHGFATIDFKKTEKEKTYDAVLNYYPRINKNSQILLCLSDKVKSDFSNVEKVKYDTIIVKNGRFPIVFGKNGPKIIRGFVLERYPKNPNDTLTGNKKPIIFYETKTYLEQKFNVK
ncbi:hypothetical protein ABGT15_12950 [Flavobacterium enshiense]|uniref:hypothetical protein n=1 Tax=Flavobacterium enshiense TaxID=1341165 RepID=UPI00345D3C70